MPPACSSVQIVLAEDNPADVLLVREALREHDVRCDLRVITDGQQALTFIDELDADKDLPCPDLLILDLYLPKYDGGQILGHLRDSGRCADIPVVVLTSSLSPQDQRTAEKNAAIHYFQKPASLSQFLKLGSIVKEVISRTR